MREIRRRIFFITVILVAIGIVMIYSASAVFAYERLKDSAYYLKRHLSYLMIGIALVWIVLQGNYLSLRKYAKVLIIISILLLILVLIPGASFPIGGARRWFKFGLVSFQPAELAKFALIVYLSDYGVRNRTRLKNYFSHLFGPIMVVILIATLLVLQPDLGTAILLGTILFLYMIIFEVRIKYISGLILVCLPAMGALIFSSPYRRNRILAFLNPWQDLRGSGFQIVQSLLAFGRGGIWGRGLGQSQQKLLYLPAAHTDFIFSIIAEEWGLVGSLALLILFALFFWEAGKIPFRVKNEFGQFLSLGIILLLGLETLINLGVSVGILPTKGLPLPFISYGGTALVFNLVYVALLLNIARDRNV